MCSCCVRNSSKLYSSLLCSSYQKKPAPGDQETNVEKVWLILVILNDELQISPFVLSFSLSLSLLLDRDKKNKKNIVVHKVADCIFFHLSYQSNSHSPPR